ncbi:MAG: RICIN domain-containing protein, partial [Clostridia bacterium]|nr:RICIN domain-containing protein [Clostridia bacterium]
MKRKLIALLLTLALALSLMPIYGIVPAGADDDAQAIDLPGCARAALFDGYSEQSRKYLADRLQRYEAVLYNDVATDAEFEAAWDELQSAYDSLKPMHGFELIPLNGFSAWTDEDLEAMIESSSTPVFDREHAPDGVDFAISVSGEGGAVFSNGANRSGVAGQSPFGLDMSKADGLKFWLYNNTGVSKYTVTIGLRSGVDNYAYSAYVYSSGYVYIPFEYFTTTGEYPLAKDGSLNYIRIESDSESFCVADFNAYNEILETSNATPYSETKITARSQIENNAYYKIIETTTEKAITLGPPVSETSIRWGNTTLAVEDNALKYSLEENREGDRTQMWQLSLSPAGNGTFRLINKSSSNVLTISESGVSIEAKEISMNDSRQEWSISISAGKATIQVRNVGKLTTAGETVKATNGTTYKKFYLYKVVETEYVQSWSDEFDGDSLDRTKWNVSDGQTDGAIYPDDDDLIDVSNGNLNFKSEYRRSDAYEMRGTYMNTSGKFAF